jgi:hypothetical protein
MNPLVQLTQWLGEEQLAGNPFAHGAVLGTVGRDGALTFGVRVAEGWGDSV